MSSGLEDSSLFDLFRMEAEEQVCILQGELMQIESEAASASRLEKLMRASHSLKGAARIVGLASIVSLTHAMEDRFVAAQHGAVLDSAEIDRMLAATDWLARLQLIGESEINRFLQENASAIEVCAGSLRGRAAEPGGPEANQEPSADIQFVPQMRVRTDAGESPDPASELCASSPGVALPASPPMPDPEVRERDIFGPSSRGEQSVRERTVRIRSDRFDHMLSLSAESLVGARQVAGWGDALDRNQRAIGKALQMLEDADHSAAARATLRSQLERHAAVLATQIADLESVSRANELTVERLYRTVLGGRLRPFSEGVTGVPRLVRETARELGKQVRLQITGETTRVDREIQDKLESPISHLVTNAIDHGIELPTERLATGKPAEATLRIHAGHENGRLVVTVRDDGKGIDPDEIRERVISRKVATPETLAGLTETELLEFLFLPGFSTRDVASHLSGRGVGLNVVQSMVQEAGGSVTVSSTPGLGTTFRLTLPVTRSVIRVIRVQAEGELFSVPMVRIDHVTQEEPGGEIDKPTVMWNGRAHPVVRLASLLGFSDQPLPKGALSMLLSGGFAFAVERLVDQVELSVRRLDARLGKVPGVSAASLDENGVPLLILDMDDLIQAAAGTSTTTRAAEKSEWPAPHILVVDDSHTVREMERRLLVRAGYTVSTAQNGQEAWNLLRLNEYDLLISDVDMPQMNGIELVTRVRANPRLGRMPVIILSYKDRAEDRQRGLDAGADLYLTKGSFDNGSFVQAVVDLVGDATPLVSGDSA